MGGTHEPQGKPNNSEEHQITQKKFLPYRKEKTIQMFRGWAEK